MTRAHLLRSLFATALWLALPGLAQAATATLEITRVDIRDLPDPFGFIGQYQAMISLGGSTHIVPGADDWETPSHRNFAPSVPWTHQIEWDPENGPISVTIEMWDGDGGTAREYIDLDSASGVRTYSFEWDLLSGDTLFESAGWGNEFATDGWAGSVKGRL